MEAAIKNLSVEEKMILMEELREDIEKERLSPLSESQLNHIRSRIQDYQEKKEKGKNWEELRNKYLES
jgi:putative addiction module component (TIGR02574 family)